MALIEMVMPKMGESIMEGTILTWLKKEGDAIEQDESVLEVATDKVDTEVPAIHSGILKQILAKEGEVVQVGKPIAIIATDAADASDPAAPAAEAAKPTSAPGVAATEEAPVAELNGNGHSFEHAKRFYSPLVKSIAKEEKISLAELESIQGTGKEGRVTKADILAYVKDRPAGGVPVSKPAYTQASPITYQPPAVQVPAPAMNIPVYPGDEIVEMDRMRKMIAQRMLDSKRISPHVTSFVEADVTGVALWRNKVKKAFQDKEGDTLTYTPIFIEAVVKAIKDYPMMNISIDGDKIIKRRDINIGMAVALPSGNLIVPVIRNADQLNIVGLTKKVNDLAKRARENKLKAEELEGGTFTISNVGSFGNVMGTPIIMQPQVGILALGAIVKKPAVLETPTGDVIAIRHKMFLSHSYDHRVVDGSLGGMFVRRVADYLEKWDVNRSI
jgi:2-oxoglutarate dehydrogenase E2 component (dihydrolipoamide succinyltransferase)